MKHIILGTAGHIDHGKTTLIKALTDIDTDRLPEEKSRGITIELGFAHLSLGNDLEFGIVDVPGHEKFIHHMVAGVGGIDIVMLIIAADEGVMPQTREHVAICDLLGVKCGFVVLTKTDMVDDEWLELVQEDVSDFMEGTFLADTPIVRVSSKTGQGLDTLKDVLSQQAELVSEKSNVGLFRVPVDRVFTIRGFGTVVTGTVNAGSIALGEAVTMIPDGPGCKIRGLQVHGRNVDTIQAGQRAAINLQGVDRDIVRRGMLLCRPGELSVTYMVDGFINLLKAMPRPIKNRTQIRFYSGTSEVLGRLILLDREELLPGGSAPVQIRLVDPIACLTGDRFLLRSYSPVITIGGGKIINAEPVKHKRYDTGVLKHLESLGDDDLNGRFATWLDVSGISGVCSADICRTMQLSAEKIHELVDEFRAGRQIVVISGNPDRYIGIDAWSEFKKQVLDIVTRYHQQQPLKSGLSREELRTSFRPNPEAAVLQTALKEFFQDNTFVDMGQAVRLTGFSPSLSPQQEIIRSAVVETVTQRDQQGGKLQEINESLSFDLSEIQPIVQYLLDMDVLIRIGDGLIFTRDVIDRFREVIRTTVAKEGSIKVGGLRDACGISRKQAVPILEYFDSIGLTRRVKDHRVLKNA